MKETQVPSLNQEDPLEEDLAAHSSILIRKSMDKSLASCHVHGVTMSQTQLKRLTMVWY